MYIGQTTDAVRTTPSQNAPESQKSDKPRPSPKRYALRKTNKGFTLAEAVLATSILAFAALAVVMPFSSGAAVRAEGSNRTIAAALVTDLMEQVMTTSPNLIVGAWDGYSEAQGEVIKDFTSSTPFTDPAYANFSRSCTCQYVYMAQQSGTASPNFVAVTVTVARNGNDLASIIKLISL